MTLGVGRDGRLVHGALFMETTVMEQWLLHLTEPPPTFRERYMAMEQKKMVGVASLIVVLENPVVVSRVPELELETAGFARQFLVYFLRFAAICVPFVNSSCAQIQVFIQIYLILPTLKIFSCSSI